MFITGLRKLYSEQYNQSSVSTVDNYIYLNDSIKVFETDIDANKYCNYLNETSKYPKEYLPFLFPLKLYKDGELNMDDLLKKDVLIKLSAEEKRVLGL